jgi:hypothetical protein
MSRGTHGRFAGLLALGVVALALGCSATGKSANDAGMTAAADLAIDPCTTGTVPLSYFTTPLQPGAAPICRAQYTDELDDLRCSEAQGNCAGYRVIGFPNIYYHYDCFYDSTSGALVGGFVTSDQGPSCSAGSAHAECGNVDYTIGGSCDGGTP